jgi:hypothetical protein
VRIACLPRAFLLFGVLALTACGGGAGESTDTSSTDDARPRKEKPVAEQGKEWSGWRWKGKRQDCFFKVGNECHSSLEAACKAAGCGKSSCVHDDGAPARVSCEK